MSTRPDDRPEPHAANEQDLLALEAKHASWGDTVHYLTPPKFFADIDATTSPSWMTKGARSGFWMNVTCWPKGFF